MAAWDGRERRKDTYHEILIRIDANLENAIAAFAKHEIKDEKTFETLFNKLEVVEKVCYGLGGVLVFIEIISKIIK